MFLQNKNDSIPLRLNSLPVRLTKVVTAHSEHNHLDDLILIGFKTWFHVLIGMAGLTGRIVLIVKTLVNSCRLPTLYNVSLW